MSQYVLRIGEALNFVLENACAAQPEQFAGYCGNIEFWYSEYAHLEALVEGYEDRLDRMRDARQRFMDEADRSPQNKDEFGELYQTPRPTTTKSQRKDVLINAKDNLKRFLNRGRGLGCIDIELYDTIMEKLEPTSERHRAL